MVAEVMVVVDIGVVSGCGIMILVLVQGRSSPVVIDILFIDFGNLVEAIVFPLLVPLLAEIRTQVVSDLTVHRKSGNHGTEIPVRRNSGIHRVDDAPVVTCQVLHQHGRVEAAAEQSVRIVGRSCRLHTHGVVEDTGFVGCESGIVLMLLTRLDIEAEREALGDLYIEV